MRLIHKGLLLVAIPFLQAVLVIGAMFWFILQTDHQRAEETRQRKLAELGNQTMMLIYDSAWCLGRIFLDGDMAAKADLRYDIDTLKHQREKEIELDPASVKDPLSRDIYAMVDEWLDSLRGLFRHLNGAHLSLELLDEADKIKRHLANKSFDLLWRCHEWTCAVIDDLLQAPQRQQRTFQAQTNILVGGVFASIFTAWLLARSFNQGITTRLRVISDNALRMARQEPLNPPLGGTDEIARVDGAFHSMSAALRDAIAKERALFESSTDLICITDGAFRLSAVNPAWTAELGFLEEAALGRSLVDFADADDKAKVAEALEEARQMSRPTAFEARLVDANGRAVDLMWSAYWSRLDDALYLVAHDITESKNAERARQEFLAMVAHDLRSPLTAIYGSFQLINSGALGAVSDEDKAKINSASSPITRLISLINDLLDLEKLEAGKLELARAESSVSEMVLDAVVSVEDLAQSRGINVHRDCAAVDFSMDRDRIQQALVNLLENLISYSTDGGQITIAARREDAGLFIDVHANRCTIPPAHRDVMFDRFQQVALPRSTSAQGAFGLPISKSIVAAHGGTLGLNSSSDGGTTFQIFLPTVSDKPTIKLPDRPIAQTSSHVVVSPKIAAPNGVSFWRNMRLWHKGLLLVVVPVIFEIFFAGSLLPLLSASHAEEQKELHQRLVATAANDLFMNFYAVNFAMQLTPPERSVAGLRKSFASLQEREELLLKLTKASEESGQIVRKLVYRAQRFQSFVQNGLNELPPKNVTDDDLLNAFPDQEDQIRRLSRLGPLFERLIEVANLNSNDAPIKLAALRNQQGVFLLTGLLCSFIICVVSAILFSSDVVRRLNVMSGNIRRLERNEPLQAQVSGSDEVAAVDHEFHAMAAALKEARKREQAIFDNASDVLCIVNRGGDILRVSPACDRQWGRSADELTGTSVLKLIDPPVRMHFAESLAKVANDRLPMSVETVVERSSNETRDFRWALSWSETEGVVIAIAHDVTERKQLERLKQQFRTVITEELRAPLEAVNATTKELMKSVSEKPAEQLSVVARNCDRLLRLVADMLVVEKADSGQLTLERSNVHARDILSQASETLAAMAQQKQITVAIEADADASLNADGEKLVQVVINLLSNAIKFSPNGSSVQLAAVKTDGGAIEFSVKDSRRGVPVDQRDAIFERFRQVTAADGKRSAGTGLGLPICKQIITQHGGEIGVRDGDSAGSVFYFSLPS